MKKNLMKDVLGNTYGVAIDFEHDSSKQNFYISEVLAYSNGVGPCVPGHVAFVGSYKILSLNQYDIDTLIDELIKVKSTPYNPIRIGDLVRVISGERNVGLEGTVISINNGCICLDSDRHNYYLCRSLEKITNNKIRR